MKRVFTSDEMRVRANYLEGALADAKTAAMLRQAADMMEREEREKKYEYGVTACGVDFVYQTRAEAEHKQAVLEGANYHYPIVRREVGEWEGVE